MLSGTYCIVLTLYYVLKFMFVLGVLILVGIWWLMREALSPRGSEATPSVEREKGDDGDDSNG